MKRILEGVRHFRSHVYPQSREFYKELSKGQHPEALFVTCADSRIVPNVITQTPPGMLFIARNAGNMVPPHGSGGSSESASIEYSVKVLGVKHIIVCGHTGCGAMKFLMDASADHKALPHVSGWVSQAREVRRRCEQHGKHLSDGDTVSLAIEQNVLLQLEHLMSYPFVRDAVEAGKLQLHGWVFHLESGDIVGYDDRSEKFKSLTKED